MERKTAPQFDQEVLDLYDGVNHGFHNDTTPRCDEAAAKLAWTRTMEFFKKTLLAG